MGKKRRINAGTAKFRAKHSHHPRMKLLNIEVEEGEESVTIIEDAPKVTLREQKTETVKLKTETTPKIKKTKSTAKRTIKSTKI